MEARNLISAREMVNDGHWIFTTLNNMPRYEKPPLPTWITAFFMLIGGMHNMFWLRLPVVLVTLLLVYFFYRTGKEIQLKNNHPFHAGLVLITSFYIFFSTLVFLKVIFSALSLKFITF
jgi:4-amino-4-deoxy-L-arabinose transferase-like glycosyltransferase